MRVGVLRLALWGLIFKGHRTQASLPRLFLLICLLYPLPCSAQNALVLIQHDRAGPNIPSADEFFAEWIRWPADQPGRDNRILALATGADLQGEQADESFPLRGVERLSGNASRLRRRGAFAARDAEVGRLKTTVLNRREGGVSANVLLIALSDPRQPLTPQPFDAPLPRDGLVVAEAGKHNWDDVAEIARRVSGRTLVVEYPPAGEDGWSRFWTKGKGWPEGVPTESDLKVPGIVRGRSALALLLHPERFAWGATQVGRWGGANRWLEHGRATTPGILLGWYALAAFVIAWALAQVMNEDRGPFVSELLVLVALSPAALVLAGKVATIGGLDSWPIVLGVVLGGLYASSSMASLGARRWVPEAHPLWAPCAVGLACLAFCDPLWSDLSGRFGAVELDVPGQAVGALLAYGTGVAAFARGRWLGRGLVAAALLWGVTARPWWVEGHSALLVVPAIALVAAEGLFGPAPLLVLAFLPTGLARLAREGVAWSPEGLLAFADERGSLNLWQSFVLLFSPAWLVTVALTLMGMLIGNRFLAYRLRQLLRHDPRLRALPWAAAGVAALGVTEPLAIPAVPVVVLGAFVALAYDGLRANA